MNGKNILGNGPMAVLAAFATTVILVSTAIGFIRAFTMPAMGTSSGGHVLHGMPLADMPEMLAGVLGLIVLVFALACRRSPPMTMDAVPPLRARVVLLIATLGCVVDVSKTSTLGFVIPGIRVEYEISGHTASALAVCGLAGTAVGALLCTTLTVRFGYRSTYLVAACAFTFTSMCGAMPSFLGNLVMCGLMGVAVGGLAPLLLAIIGNTLSPHRRGPMMVALSIVATALGYLVAAGSALWLQPEYGWRILWLIGAPTGALLVMLSPLLPHRPRAAARPDAADTDRARARQVLSRRAQCCHAVLVGLLAFGLTTWLPTLAEAGGVPVATANALLTVVALTLVPCAVLVALAYLRFGPEIVIVTLGTLCAVVLLATTVTAQSEGSTQWCVAALLAGLFCVNTMSAVFLPVAADLADSATRVNSAGIVSLWNRLGGLAGPAALAWLINSMQSILLTVGLFAAACAATAAYIYHRHRVTIKLAESPDT